MMTASTSTAFLSTCSPDTVHFRIYTFGSFHIDWVDPTTGQTYPLPPERFQGQNAGTSLGLLKALLSCPDRFATRSWLVEQFWPTSRHQRAQNRLNDVVSSLRGILRPPDSKAMLVHYVYGTNGQGAGFRLDAFPQIWCDADAFVWCVTHGMLLDQRGQDSTACWERAYALAERGSYLPDLVYEEWARPRRDYVMGLLRDCVQCWTRLLRQMGHVDEAIMRLRAYWLEHLTDEDALRALLEMLGERERIGEAEECYAKTQTVLEEDGYKPHVRTQETLEVVRALRVQRPLQLHGKADISSVAPSFLFSGQQSSLPVTSQVISRDIIEAARLLQGTTGMLFHLGETTMFDPTKRQTLETLLAAISVALVQPQGLLQLESWKPLLTAATDSTKVNAEAMQGLQSLIEGCWQLSRGNQLALAEKLLPECMDKLVPLAQQPSSYQQRAINLTAQGFLLSGLFALHRNNVQVRDLYYQQAVQYSRLSGDQRLLIPALRGIGTMYFYGGQYTQALHAYQEALQHVESASPLLQANVYMNLAVAYAHLDQKQKALTYVGLARDTFPDHPETDPSFSFAEFDQPRMILWEGIALSRLGQTQQAFNTFGQIEQPAFAVPERTRIEIINQRAKTAILSGDLEQGAASVEMGFLGAKALGSQRRYSEAYENFQQMRLLWPQEKRVTELGELLH